MRQYVGSVAVSRDGARIAATSPVGGRMLVFDVATRNLVATRDIADVCGVAGDGGDFFVSDGRGRLWRGDTLLSQDPAVAWDNHLRRVGVISAHSITMRGGGRPPSARSRSTPSQTRVAISR